MKLRDALGQYGGVSDANFVRLANQNRDKVTAANSHSSRFKRVGTRPEVAQVRESVEMTRRSHCF
jgi:hypothetical protein